MGLTKRERGQLPGLHKGGQGSGSLQRAGSLLCPGISPELATTRVRWARLLLLFLSGCPPRLRSTYLLTINAKYTSVPLRNLHL